MGRRGSGTVRLAEEAVEEPAVEEIAAERLKG
jgi:hypothetical protein